MTESKRNRWALRREVDSILGQTMAGLFLYLIENVGEIIYPADSINIVPPLRKHESFQMMVCLAEIQICCCFCCCFTKIESLFLEEPGWWVTLKTLFFQKRNGDLLLRRCMTSDRLPYSLQRAHLSAVSSGLQVLWWYVLSPPLFWVRKWQLDPAQGIAICTH